MSKDSLPDGLVTYQYEATYFCIGCPSCGEDNWRQKTDSWKHDDAPGTKCWKCGIIMVHEEMLEYVEENIPDDKADMEEGLTWRDYIDCEEGKKSI
jgi:hypothetical protein